jgi:hypothetical protein
LLVRRQTDNRLSEQYALTRWWGLNGAAIVTPGSWRASPGLAGRRLFVQRFGGMSRYIGENQVGGSVSHKYASGNFVDGCLTDLIECCHEFRNTTEVACS